MLAVQIKSLLRSFGFFPLFLVFGLALGFVKTVLDTKRVWAQKSLVWMWKDACIKLYAKYMI